jgi:hypothetical protein
MNSSETVTAYAIGSDTRPASYKLPATPKTLILRTDFSLSSEWETLVNCLRDLGPCADAFEFLSDPAFDGLTAVQLVALLAPVTMPDLVFVADRAALARPGQQMLVIDAASDPEEEIRATPAEMLSIHILTRMA